MLRLLPLVLLLVPAGLAAQLPFGVAVEGRAGFAVPQGELTESEGGVEAGGGAALAVGARIEALPGVSLFGGYQQSWLSCGSCEAVGLEDRAVVRGYEAGLQLALPLSVSGFAPWVRGGLAQQSLEFSGFGETARSEAGLGFVGAAGVNVPLAGGRLELSPAVHYRRSTAEFDFTVLPDRELDLGTLTVDVGLAIRL